MNTDHLLFSESNAVLFGGNIFMNVPTILQFEDTPIIEVVKEQALTRTTQFSIYGNDGVYLAKVKGPRLFLTEHGEKANLTLNHPDKMTVCQLNGQTLFEVRRDAAAAVALTAELFTPTGFFVRSNSSVPFGTFSQNGTQIGKSVFIGNLIAGSKIGFLVTKDGMLKVG